MKIFRSSQNANQFWEISQYIRIFKNGWKVSMVICLSYFYHVLIYGMHTEVYDLRRNQILRITKATAPLTKDRCSWNKIFFNRIASICIVFEFDSKCCISLIRRFLHKTRKWTEHYLNSKHWKLFKQSVFIVSAINSIKHY